MNKVYWVSRHPLSPAQERAIRHLHGEVEVVHDPVVFNDPNGLRDYIREHSDGFVYAVAGAVHCLRASVAHETFGIFENYPEKRADGAFGLKAVYHHTTAWEEQLDARICLVDPVWINLDPAADEGDALVPVLRS